MTTIRSTQQAKPCWIIVLLDHEMCAISAVNSPAVRWLFDGIYLFHDTQYCLLLIHLRDEKDGWRHGTVGRYDVWACKTEWRLEQRLTD